MAWGRAAVGFGLGLGLALGAGAAGRPAPLPEGTPVAMWAADRGGDRVVGLDADLFVRRVIEVRAPVAVEPGPRGGAWIACSPAPGEGRVVGIEVDGSVHTDLRVGPVQDLLGLGEDVVALERCVEGGVGGAWHVGEGRAPRALSLPRGVERGCGAWGAVVVATRFDELFVIAPDGAVLAAGSAPGRPLALARGPRPWTWWCLVRVREHGGKALALVDAHLVASAVAPAPASAARLVESAQGCVWILEERGRRLHLRRPGGRVEPFGTALPLGNLRAGLARSESLFVAAPGAVLAFDADGRVRPGQGGFDFLVDLAPASTP